MTKGKKDLSRAEKVIIMENRKIRMDRGEVMNKDSYAYARCQKLREGIINARPRLCIERARLVTESYKQTEGMDIEMRRALAFDHILSNMEIFILPDELIVGNQAEYQRSAPIFPEMAVEWIAEELDDFTNRPQDPFYTSDEVKDIFMNEIYPYWKGKTLSDRVNGYMTDEMKLERFDAQVFSLGLHEEGGLGHVLFDYGRLIRKGYRGFINEIQEKLHELDPTEPDALSRKRWYQAAVIVLEAEIKYANRFADLAQKQAAEEKDERRKKELEKLAAICRKVPEYPAETFYEALQSMWIPQITSQIYDNGVSITPGRMDQYLYDLYVDDILQGRATKEEQQEVLECFWMKLTEAIKIYRLADCKIHAGFPMGQNIVIGGVTSEGDDATNDLSYRCLEAHKHMHLMQPNFSVRLHKNTPEDFLQAVVEAIKVGNGMPQIDNDEAFIPALMNIGIPAEIARDYAPVGCVEINPPDTWGRVNGGYFNVAKVAELALTDGFDNISKKQVGPHTGKPEDLKTFEDVLHAYEEQMDYAVKLIVAENQIIDQVHAELDPVMLVSCMVGGCIESGKDVTRGGAVYNWTAPLGLGIANACDILYSVKKTVFDDKMLTMEEMVDAMNTNFEGKETLRQYLLNKVPKYGNDIPEVDCFARYASDVWFDAMEGYEGFHGGPFVGSFVPVAANVAFGYFTGATPDGRLSGTILADGISPSNGVDHNGPTAAMKSISKLNHLRIPNGVIYNQKFNPTAVATPEGTRKFSQMIRTYINLGGGHVQFNMVTADQLKEAQDKPEDYKSLVVRVAGYSAFFNELSKPVQDSIITRTEIQEVC